MNQRRSSGAVVVILTTIILLSSGCWWSTGRTKQAVGNGDVGASSEPINLRPSLWIAPSLTGATLSYANACGESQVVSVGGPLTDIITEKLGRAFSGLVLNEELGHVAGTAGTDGVIEIGVGTKRAELFLPPRTAGTYAARITLELEAAFLAEDGTALFHTKFQETGHGEVQVADQSCEVSGVEALVRQTSEAVGERLLKQLRDTTRIREYAKQKGSTPRVASVPLAPGLPMLPNGEVAEGALFRPVTPPASVLQETTLAFLAIVRDESQDHLLDPGEALTIEVEVKNEGPVEAKNVEVVIGGTGLLTKQFPPVLLIGTVRPGEVKAVSVTKPVPPLREEQDGELVLSIRSLTPLEPPPTPKQFVLPVKTDKSSADAADAEVFKIDQPPVPLSLSKQAKAVVIAIGIGTFRDEHVPPLKYAERDATVMAAYLKTIASVPDRRARLLVDHFALKEDLEDVFDDWLPKHVDAETVVYIFYAGRALVDGKTGAVSLVPFDGSTKSTKRLYPIRRLQQTLARLPIQRVIMMFDVSLDPWPGANPATTPHPDWWEGADEEKDHVMWMVGNRSLQEAHVYDPGKHGLFTYYLLKGMQGLADIDRDGTVVAGELCLYARKEVIHTAREQFGSSQYPLCSPPPGQGAVVRIHPMARGNNPKSAASVKQTAPSEEVPRSTDQPLKVGPGL
ncbi:MAG: hypothetical protein NNA18_04595 [Nitrospira sp.]|nr:hypothetical protein [Nitrospira sp.]